MYKINEIVKITNLDLDGIIKEVYPNKVKVAVKNSFLMVDKKNIASTGIIKHSSGKATYSKTTMKVNELDLHGLTYDEAMDELDKFFNLAITSKQRKLHIIHGHGKGVMKRALEDTLVIFSEFVEYSFYAPLNKGGIGATRIILK